MNDARKTVAAIAPLGALTVCLLLAGAASCGDRGPADDVAGAIRDAGADGVAAVAPGCRPGAGASGAPVSIREVIDLVNSLPRPVTLACFLESLDRPLYASATFSTISLQPAAGQRSPRVLLISDRLIMTVVPAGSGSHTIELGEFVTATRTVKAEVGFPVARPLGPSDPFDRIRDPMAGTTCRGCHADEIPVEFGYPNAFISGAMRPHERTRVELDSLRTERAACDPIAEPDRCANLGALLDHGPVLPRDLPSTIPTIFD